MSSGRATDCNGECRAVAQPRGSTDGLCGIEAMHLSGNAAICPSAT